MSDSCDAIHVRFITEKGKLLLATGGLTIGFKEDMNGLND
jgi:hypothetical protein